MIPQAGSIGCDLIGPVAVLRVDRPGRRNAMSRDMWLGLAALLRRLAADADVGGLVLTGGEPGHFIAGQDLDELAAVADREDAVRLFGPVLEAIDLLESFPGVTIALVDGPAIGSGLELAAACDLRVATRRALFQIPGLSIGVPLPAGNARRLCQAFGRHEASRLVFAGERIASPDAERLGLVHALVEPEGALEAALALARRATRSPALARAVKSAMLGHLRAGRCDEIDGEAERCAPYLVEAAVELRGRQRGGARA